MTAQRKYKVGDRFFHWTFVEKLDKGLWRVRCDCGAERVGASTTYAKGHTRQCSTCNGLSKRTAVHSDMYTARSWYSMRDRCNNPSHLNAKHYRDRGISYCPEWESFDQFLRDMGPRPPKHSLDRIDNGKGYSKDNCRWATQSQQMRNTRAQKARGLGAAVVELAEASGVPTRKLLHRVNKGIGVDEAVAGLRNGTLASRARTAGITPSIVQYRVRQGWTEEEALSTPVGVRRS